MPQNPDIQYIRVRHLGETTGSLHIDDLDTEANKKQPHQIPVYIPEGGSVDLPLNDQVLLSFNQGTLRSFINQGLVSGFVIANDGSAEVWVSPEGDDSNPGTRSAPFASIEHAVDSLKNKYAANRLKIVNIEPNWSRYSISRPVIINEPHFIVRGREDGYVRVTREGDFPAFIVTSVSDQAMTEFIDDGGFSYSLDPSTGVYEYLGQGLSRLDTEMSPVLSDFNTVEAIRVSNIAIQDLSSVDVPGVAIIGPPSNSGTATVRRVEVDRISGNKELFLKNTSETYINGGIYSNAIVDNAAQIYMEGGQPKNSLNASTLIAELYLHKQILDPDKDVNVGWFLQSLRGFRFAKVYAYSPSTLRLLDTPTVSQFGAMAGESRIRGAVQLGRVDRPVAFNSSAGNFSNENSKFKLFIEDSAQLFVTGLALSVLEKTSTGNMRVDNLVAFEDVVISGGTSNQIYTGTIEGNLTVSGGATIDLTGVHVLGDVDLTGAGTVTWRGGSYYGSLTDPDTKMGGALPGDYLNVTP